MRPGAAAPAIRNPSELMRPLGKADRLVHEEAHPILPQLVELVLESIDCTRFYTVSQKKAAIKLELQAIDWQHCFRDS